MQIKIYQINMDRDAKNLAFMGTEFLERKCGGMKIDSTIYDEMFAGDVDCKTLEGVFRMFNLNRPQGYSGRSLSVSDVVSVCESESVETGFYYCDTVGFKRVAFEPEKAGVRLLTVVLVEPEKPARIARIDPSLESLQAVVGGYIEAIYPFEDPDICMVCNEEGKLQHLQPNRALREEETTVELSYKQMKARFTEAESKGQHLTGYITFTQDSFSQEYSEKARTYELSSNNKAFQQGLGGYSIFATSLDGADLCIRLEQYMADEHGGKNGWKIERCFIKVPSNKVLDLIAGTFFICGCGGERFSSLTPEHIQTYLEMFKLPEELLPADDGKVLIIPVSDDNNNDEGE